MNRPCHSLTGCDHQGQGKDQHHQHSGDAAQPEFFNLRHNSREKEGKHRQASGMNISRAKYNTVITMVRAMSLSNSEDAGQLLEGIKADLLHPACKKYGPVVKNQPWPEVSGALQPVHQDFHCLFLRLNENSKSAGRLAAVRI